MARKSKIPFRNQNHTGWWIFEEVEQWVSDRQSKLTQDSKCLVWINTRILKAKNREEAYRKAIKLGKECHPSRTNDGEWQFAGISNLMPVYDKIADGSEIMWTDKGKISLRAIQKLVKQKNDLSVFNDDET